MPEPDYLAGTVGDPHYRFDNKYIKICVACLDYIVTFHKNVQFDAL